MFWFSLTVVVRFLSYENQIKQAMEDLMLDVKTEIEKLNFEKIGLEKELLKKELNVEVCCTFDYENRSSIS